MLRWVQCSNESSNAAKQDVMSKPKTKMTLSGLIRSGGISIAQSQRALAQLTPAESTAAPDTRQELVILCEGRDAAGKGGTIKRFMGHLNPLGTLDREQV